MIFTLIMQGQFEQAVLLIIVIVISLSFHEFGHAWTANKFGDNTAERQGRLTLNPVAHIDPMGLLLVAMVGFGYAKPVPTDPRNFNSPKASLWISAAGPGMNLLLAFLSINLLVATQVFQIDLLNGMGPFIFLQYMVFINLLLMLFNLLPIGPLDGHYILPYFLSRDNAYKYVRWNDQYGAFILLSLVVLSFLGVPIFSFLSQLAMSIAQYLVIF
ncbi:site-2 protease family protein [Aliikangiella coralliicola]|uniref:Site-2 protease family protein n=1 Tax=Aliikangiella coralliicola TaxID=2592383 RepID=A0A545UBP3_9GAMM|nr:site-2 protease family protein [Aliikangiella coralliicola]TQV86877.1 site-2 protease family protein [Aliikangiella coralliicola]